MTARDPLGPHVGLRPQTAHARAMPARLVSDGDKREGLASERVTGIKDGNGLVW
jgi:hypothetical protein